MDYYSHIQIIYYVLGVMGAAYAVKKLIFDNIERWFTNRAKLTASVEDMAKLRVETDLLHENAKSHEQRLVLLESRQATAFERIDESRLTMREYMEQHKATLNIMCRGISALIDSQLHDGNNKEALKQIKEILDQQKSII